VSGLFLLVKRPTRLGHGTTWPDLGMTVAVLLRSSFGRRVSAMTSCILVKSHVRLLRTFPHESLRVVSG
jgi:hypothetical protein